MPSWFKLTGRYTSEACDFLQTKQRLFGKVVSLLQALWDIAFVCLKTRVASENMTKGCLITLALFQVELWTHFNFYIIIEWVIFHHTEGRFWPSLFIYFQVSKQKQDNDKRKGITKSEKGKATVITTVVKKKVSFLLLV
jgi:hypothetical protein